MIVEKPDKRGYRLRPEAFIVSKPIPELHPVTKMHFL